MSVIIFLLLPVLPISFLLDFLFFHMFLKLPEHLPVPSRKTDISSCPFPLQLNFAVYLCNISIHNTPHNTCIHYISHNRFLNSHVCFLQSFSKTILKIIPYYRTVFHSESSVFFVCHIVEIGLLHSRNSIVCHKNIGFFVRFLFDLIQQIIDPLCQMQSRFSSFVAARETFFCFLKCFAVSCGSFPLSKTLFCQTRLDSCRYSGDLRNMSGSIRRSDQRRI